MERHALPTLRQLVTDAIVLDHARMVHGQIRRPLFEVAHRVSAGTHHFFDQIGTIGAILSAILAVLLWPLILLGVKIAIVI